MLNQLFDLTGRTALVTGGSKGIGKSIARGYAEAGANVVITARHEDELQAACAEIGDGLDVQVAYRLCEMTDRAQCDDMIRSVQAEFPIVDILCNNAGSNAPQPLVDIDDADWDRVLELNFTSCMRLARAFWSRRPKPVSLASQANVTPACRTIECDSPDPPSRSSNKYGSVMSFMQKPTAIRSGAKCSDSSSRCLSWDVA